MRHITVLLGRLFFSAIFIVSGFSHFSPNTIGYAAQNGVPAAGFLVPAAGVLAIVGGISVLLGWRTRWGAWLLVVFLVPVTLSIHRFWTYADPIMRMQQQAHFMKNLSMLGGALLLTYFGGGPLSLDQKRLGRRLSAAPGETTREARIEPLGRR